MKVWFITGTSKGFGRIWAEAALERGDLVVATARNVGSLDDLVEKYGANVLALPLDVTDRAAVFDTVRSAHARFGRLDVVINNAGFGQFGAVEELTEEEARNQMETNFFGALWVTQAVLPILREQRSGHIIQVSSIGGVMAFQNIGMYHASKWALEAISQSLSEEVAEFNIHVTLVEPTGYSTDWGGPSAKHATPLAAYQPARDANALRWKDRKRGDPDATAPVMLQLVDMPNPPLRIFFGKGTVEMAHGEYAKRLKEWDTFKALSDEAQG